MPEEYSKKSKYAQQVEDRLRRRSSNKRMEDFDHDVFMNEFKRSKQEKELPDPDIFIFKQVKEAEARAALSGVFDPDDILPEGLSEMESTSILSFLSVNCTVVAERDTQWMLNHTRRKEVLGDLIKEGRLQDCLKENLPETDLYGTMLRRTLREKNQMPLELLGQDELVALVSVQESLQDLDIDRPDPAKVRSRIKTPGLLDGYAAISVNFIGRVQELKLLHQFVKEGPDPTVNRYPWKGYVVTGLGGVGKSALIAKLASEIGTNNGIAVSVLDFDRPGIKASDKAWLTQEICRQLAQQYPQLSDILTSALDQNQLDQGFYSLGKGSVSESDLSTDQISLLLNSIKVPLLKEIQTLLLIMDTLEEVSQMNEIGNLQDLVGRISEHLHPLNVRVIFSGRLFDDQLATVKGLSRVYDVMTIDAFDPEIAREFLMRLNVADNTALQIVNDDLFPLRPLELKLVARLLTEEHIRYDVLAGDLRQEKKGKGTSELFTGIIYRRVLLRIPDPQLRDMAYPGLILRYINADLIMEVLAPVLTPEIKMTGQLAKTIVDKLASLSWLAYRDEKDNVWHRKDLRRSMLQLMLIKDAGVTKQIRKKAIAFFSRRKSDDPAEYIYHLLMDNRDPEWYTTLKRAELVKAYEAIRVDIKDLPKAMRVFLQYSAGVKINDEDIFLLPDNYFREVYHATGARLVSERRFFDAYRLIERSTNMAKAIGLSDVYIFNWEAEVSFSLADWARVRKLFAPIKTDLEISLPSVIEEIFPKSLISYTRLDIDKFEDLTGRIRNENVFGPVSLEADRITLIYRLSVCLTILNDLGKISPDAREELGRLYENIRIKNPTPTWHKAMSLLQMIIFKKRPADFKPGVSNLCLDAEWLERLRPLMPKKYEQLLNDTLGFFDEERYNGFSPRQFLDLFDGDAVRRKSWHAVTLSVDALGNQGLYALLKGPDTIFRDPARYALLDSFTTKSDIALLAGIFNKVIGLKMVPRIRAEELQMALRDGRETALEPYIELADRRWELGKLLELASKAKPDSKKIRNVLQSYLRWEAAFKSVVSKAGN